MVEFRTMMLHRRTTVLGVAVMPSAAVVYVLTLSLTVTLILDGTEAAALVTVRPSFPTIVCHLDMAGERRSSSPIATGGENGNSIKRIFRNQRVRHKNIARVRIGGVRHEIDAIVAEISDHAIADNQTAAGVECDAVGEAGDADPIERHAVYGDVAAHRIDRDSVSASWWCDVGPALALDGDGLADGDRAVASRQSSASTSPPALVAVTAAWKCRHGAAKLHGLLSLPAAETKVRGDWACADTADSVTARATPAAMKIVRVIGNPLGNARACGLHAGQV